MLTIKGVITVIITETMSLLEVNKAISIKLGFGMWITGQLMCIVTILSKAKIVFHFWACVAETCLLNNQVLEICNYVFILVTIVNVWM